MESRRFEQAVGLTEVLALPLVLLLGVLSLGYYLIVLPLLVLLGQRLRSVNSDLAALASLAGFGYVLVGAIGAALLALIDPRLMDQYVTGSPAQRQTIAVVFDAITRGVAGGLWNVLEQVLLAGGLIGMGALVYRERRGLGPVGLAGGLFALTDALGRMVDVAPLYTVGALGTALLPVWLVWWGIELLRRPLQWPAQQLETTPMVRAG